MLSSGLFFFVNGQFLNQCLSNVGQRREVYVPFRCGNLFFRHLYVE